jgi:hypothetical protein
VLRNRAPACYLRRVPMDRKPSGESLPVGAGPLGPMEHAVHQSLETASSWPSKPGLCLHSGRERLPESSRSTIRPPYRFKISNVDVDKYRLPGGCQARWSMLDERSWQEGSSYRQNGGDPVAPPTASRDRLPAELAGLGWPS